MNELIKITYHNDQPAVSARELHEFLEVGTHFKDWFPRMCEYGFKEGEDFNLLKNERVQMEGGRMVSRPVNDAVLSIDMAKEICMIQRNEKGKLARQYFLALERDWNSPERESANHRPLAVVSNLFLRFCISERFCNTRCAGQRQRVQARFVDDGHSARRFKTVVLAVLFVLVINMLLQCAKSIAVPRRCCHVCPTPNSGRNKAKNRMNKRESNVNQTEIKQKANRKQTISEGKPKGRKRKRRRKRKRERERRNLILPLPPLSGGNSFNLCAPPFL